MAIFSRPQLATLNGKAGSHDKAGDSDYRNWPPALRHGYETLWLQLVDQIVFDADGKAEAAVHCVHPDGVSTQDRVQLAALVRERLKDIHREIRSNLPKSHSRGLNFTGIKYDIVWSQTFSDSLTAPIEIHSGYPATVIDLLILLGRGVEFLRLVAKSYLAHHRFIEFIFQETKEYREFAAYLDDRDAPNRPVVALGPPMSGKSYACLYYLYRAHILNGERVLAYFDIEQFVADADPIRHYLEHAATDRERSEGSGRVLIFLDDPFGSVRYSEQRQADAFPKAMRLIEELRRIPNCKFIITSRRGIWGKARLDLAVTVDFIHNCESVEFGPADAGTLTRAAIKHAWIRGASWGLAGLGDRAKAKQLEALWERARVRLIGAIYPWLMYDVRVRALSYEDMLEHLEAYLKKTNLLEAAFNSELWNAFEEPSPAAISTFVLLPAITELTEEKRNAIFGKDRKQIEDYVQFHFTRPDRENRLIIRYSYEPLAQVAHDILCREGHRLIPEYLFEYLEQRPVDDDVMFDVYAVFACLGGDLRGRARVKELMSPERLPALQILSYIFRPADRAGAAGCDLSDAELRRDLHILAADTGHEWPGLLSLIEQQLLDLGTYAPAKVPTSLARLGKGDALAEKDYWNGEGGISLDRVSMMLHALLAHLESYFGEVKKKKEEEEDLDHAIKQALALLPFESLPTAAALLADPDARKREASREYISFFLDAILMKIGELEAANFFLPDSPREEMRRTAQLSQALRERIDEFLREILEPLIKLEAHSEGVDIRKFVSQHESLYFIAGALFFTLCWHKCLMLYCQTTVDIFKSIERSVNAMRQGWA